MSLLLILSLLLPHAVQDFNPTFFARVIVEKNSLVKGDSTLVSVVLYSDGAFVDAKCKSGEIKLRHARLRRIGDTSRRPTGQAIFQGHRYNTLVWAQYVIASDKASTIKIPQQKFSATLRYYQRSNNPFAELWGYERKYKDFTARCTSETVSVIFTEKPKKTTETLINSGARAI